MASDYWAREAEAAAIVAARLADEERLPETLPAGWRFTGAKQLPSGRYLCAVFEGDPRQLRDPAQTTVRTTSPRGLVAKCQARMLEQPAPRRAAVQVLRGVVAADDSTK